MKPNGFGEQRVDCTNSASTRWFPAGENKGARQLSQSRCRKQEKCRFEGRRNRVVPHRNDTVTQYESPATLAPSGLFREGTVSRVPAAIFLTGIWKPRKMRALQQQRLASALHLALERLES